MKKKQYFITQGVQFVLKQSKKVALAINPEQYEVEIVHLGENTSRLGEAESAGVKSVPALVLEGSPFHINHGADLSALK